MLKAEELVAFVPTRGNKKYALAMVEQLAPLKQVFLMATHVDFKAGELPGNVTVIYDGKRYEKRNSATSIARSLGLAYCLQVDDDIRAKDMPASCEQLVNTLLEYPWLGATCSQHRMMHGMHWLQYEQSHPFVIKNFPSQFHASRIAAYDTTKGYRLVGMDDLEFGVQLWANGWATGALDLMHNEVRVRGKGVGGLPESEYEAAVQRDLAILQEHPEVLPWVEMRKDKNNRSRPKVRWNWDRMLANLQDRFPWVAYEDSKYIITPRKVAV